MDKILNQTFKKWQEMVSKGELKMKKKINKNKQQYYDFDFSKYQYYYNYPVNHLSFKKPQKQVQHLTYLLNQCTESLHQNMIDHSQFINEAYLDLKPYQLMEFKNAFYEQLKAKILKLRIKKTLIAHKFNYLKKLQNSMNFELQRSIQQVQTEIRSYSMKIPKVQDLSIQFGQNLKQRLQGKKSCLKQQKRDELHSTMIQKSDIIVYQRLIKTNMRFSFNLDIIQENLKIILKVKKNQMKNQAFIKKSQIINKLREKQTKQFHKRKDLLSVQILKTKPQFFQDFANLQLLEKFLKKFNFMERVSNITIGSYLNVNNYYKQAKYIPGNHQELTLKIQQTCQKYMPPLIIQKMLTHSSEHICYKVQNLGSILFRIISETYDLTYQIHQKDILGKRNLMKRQLQTIFSHDIQKLLGLQQHEVVFVVEEDKYQIQGVIVQQIQKTEEQIIYDKYMSNYFFTDPFLASFFQLLQTKSQKLIKQQILSYTQKINEVFCKKTEFLLLYYDNLHSDLKNHLINIINSKMNKISQEENPLQKYFCSLLQKNCQLNLELLNSCYFLKFVQTVQIKCRILDILNAQCAIMYKVKDKIQLLQRRSNIKFVMTKQFFTRYTQTNKIIQDPFDFTKEVTNLNQQVECKSHSDQIFRISKQKVIVRRMNPQNPLYQGKRIIYNKAYDQLQKLIKKCCQLGSFIIQKRQNYLPTQQLTYLVDRIQLIHEIMEQELTFQTQKLQLMEQYFIIFDMTVQPSGIQSTFKQILKLKKQNFRMNLCQHYFLDQYKCLSERFRLKKEIISQLIKIQIKIQQEQQIKVQNGMIRKNLNHSIPQISSIYYSENLNIQTNNINEQRQEDEQSSYSDHESQDLVSGLNSSRSKVSHSFMSHKTNSQYHLKKTFKQILSNNQTNNIRTQNNKKEQLLNKKKKLILNDTILGNILNFGKFFNTQKLSQSIHLVNQKFKTILQIILDQSDQKSKQQINQNLFLVTSYLQSYKTKEMRSEQILNQQLLPLGLHQCGKVLSKVCQKIKVSLTSIDQYICFPPKVLQKIIQNNTGSEIDQFRGLYLCINHIQLVQCFYRNSMRKQKQKIILKCLKQIFHKFSTLQINLNLFIPIENVLQNQINNSFKLYQNTINKDSEYLLIMGNYFNYTKLIFALDQAILNFYSAILQNIVNQVATYQQIQNQLFLIQSSDCCTDPTGRINLIPEIQNKLFVAKKITAVKELQRHVLKKEKFIEIFMFLQQRIKKIHRFSDTKLVKNAQQLVQNSKLFQGYLQAIHNLVLQIFNFTSYINYNNEKLKQHNKLQKLIALLPYINNKIFIESFQDKLFSDVFGQYCNLHSFDKLKVNQNENVKLQDQVKISYSGLKISMLKKYTFQNKKNVSELIFHQLIKRKFTEFPNNYSQKNQIKTHFFKMYSIGDPFEKKKNIVGHLEKDHMERNEYIRMVKLRYWIQQKLLLFGNSLNKQELLSFRMLLNSSLENFNIFWRDETSNLIKSSDLVKIKVNKLQIGSIKQRYKNQYLSYSNLKLKYRGLLESINQATIQVQLQDNFYLLLISKLQQIFVLKNHFQFLYTYGDIIQPKDQLKDFIINISNGNLKLTLNKLSKSYKIYDFQFYKKLLFQHQFRQDMWSQLFQFQQKQKNIRIHLNNLKKKKSPMIQTHLIYCNYKKKILEQIIKNCHIQISNMSSSFQVFAKNFADAFFKGQFQLSVPQKQIFNCSQQRIEDKDKFASIKEQAMSPIYYCQFYRKILIQKMFEISNQILNEQLDLRKALGDSFAQRQLSLDNKIINQSLNKVLAPKILLNPFLNSPLLLSNYFFAGALKMSYIDSFLNKLKNRAIIIQLAEGGFGYLLKIVELDQVVQYLCKSIISYSQKEFNDRFRTFLQHSQQMKQAIFKLQQQNTHLKALNKIHQHYQQKQVKSIVFQKLNKYLVSITEKQKNFSTFYKNFQNISLSIAKQFDEKYQNKIQELQKQNNALKKAFQQYKQKMAQVSKKNFDMSRDALYSDFKKKVQSVLNKEFIKSYQELQSKSFQEQQKQDSQILLKKLKQQKILYLLKQEKIKGQYQNKIKKLTQKLGELSKINLLLQQQKYKNKGLLYQVNQLQQTCIQIERLKKEKEQKQQEALTEKFKMIKINQSLHGRLKRYQNNFLTKKVQQKQSQEQIFITSKPRPSTQFGMQVDNKANERQFRSAKKKVPRLKTQSYSVSNIQSNEVELWRERWENSEGKYQRLYNKLKLIGQNYNITKNGKKVGQKVLFLLEEQLVNTQLKLYTFNNRGN